MPNSTELLINPDGSIFHLHLKPGDIADTILLVGDPGRVNAVKKYLHNLEVEKQNREFFTVTGYYKNKRISVISTGIGVSNIDIVLNELDALVNIDFATRSIKKQLSTLNFIRIGTTGGLQDFVVPGSYVISRHAIGLDNLNQFMQGDASLNADLLKALTDEYPEFVQQIRPYTVDASDTLVNWLRSDKTMEGITLTAPGFYASQNRSLRIPASDLTLFHNSKAFEWNNLRITNLEMESSALFHYARLMKHRAATICLVLANRITQKALLNYQKPMDEFIKYVLHKITWHR